MTSNDGSSSSKSRRLPELAYYYPDTYWRDEATSSFIKSVLLFFDGIATLVPQHAQERAIEADPTLVGPLVAAGKMKMLEPREIIDPSSVELMAAALADWIDKKSKRDSLGDRHWGSLSYTRLGSHAAPELFEKTFKLLNDRGLASHGDQVSMRIDYEAREFILTAWSQILRKPGRQMGYDLNPITSDTQYLHAPFQKNFERLLQDNRPTPVGAVITTDLEAVGVDLGRVPLDEVLDFKRTHGKQYTDYRRELNRTVATLSVVSEEQSRTILADRSAELKEQSQHLNKQIRKSFSLKSVGSFSLGLMGAAWGIRSGNIPAASVGISGALWALTKDASTPASILYLASIRNELSR